MIRARHFLEEFQRTRKVALFVQDGRLVVMTDEPLKRSDRLVLAAHADDLIEALRGDDVELKQIHGRLRLQEFGLFQMPNGQWTHPGGGDALADQILSGLIDVEVCRAEAHDAKVQAWKESKATPRQTSHNVPCRHARVAGLPQTLRAIGLETHHGNNVQSNRSSAEIQHRHGSRRGDGASQRRGTAGHPP
jgi:hypothetical protein